jgi:glutaredoxin-related protein
VVEALRTADVRTLLHCITLFLLTHSCYVYSPQVPFSTFDILSDEPIRSGLKEYSNWPTYPQLYAKGELVGGCDIVAEMAAAGELKAALA